MPFTSHHDRHIAIVLYGFAIDPQILADRIGYDDVETLKTGDRFGRHLSPKNRITWRYPMFAHDDWDNAFDRLIERLGGTDALKIAIRQTSPNAAWLRLCIPSVGSPWQESGGLERKTLARLVDIGLDFDIAAFDYNAANPTHGPRPELNQA